MLRVIKLTSLILLLVLGVILGIIILTRTNWPVYPKPPIYPGAIVVKKYEDPPIEGKSYIELKTPASARDVFPFTKRTYLQMDGSLVNQWCLIALVFTTQKVGLIDLPIILLSLLFLRTLKQM